MTLGWSDVLSSACWRSLSLGFTSSPVDQVLLVELLGGRISKVPHFTVSLNHRICNCNDLKQILFHQQINSKVFLVLAKVARNSCLLLTRDFPSGPPQQCLDRPNFCLSPFPARQGPPAVQQPGEGATVAGPVGGFLSAREL